MQTTLRAEDLAAQTAPKVMPGSFEPKNHFYPRVLNAEIHPLVGYFLRMTPERLVQRFCHMNPRVKPERLHEILAYEPRYFRWAGADLFYTTTAAGNRRMVVIETNSCPSGNKSMPIPNEDQEQGGFRTLLERTFVPLIRKRPAASGALAVLYDKNYTEASGYAAALADLTSEPVYLVPLPEDGTGPARFVDGQLEAHTEGGWIPIRAAFRYVTQRPWNRLPVRTKTRILNPVIACLAGGRNKLVASKAYDLYNAELAGTGLEIRVPETIRDISRGEIPLWLPRFGGQAVIKNPYSNAGQGVWTIVNQAELDRFMEIEHRYDRFVVQALIGNSDWSSVVRGGRFFHIGTMPNKRNEIYVADLRMMVCAGEGGFRPLAIYARRAPKPLLPKLTPDLDSWEMLGTNLSSKRTDGGWEADTDRLLLMDRRDFNRLGLGPDDLIDGYIQTVLSAIAIDKMAQNLVTTKGRFRFSLFRSLDDDEHLLSEIVREPKSEAGTPGPAAP